MGAVPILVVALLLTVVIVKLLSKYVSDRVAPIQMQR